MTSTAKRLRAVVMRVTGLGVRHWSCRIQRNSAGEYTDAWLEARTREASRKLYANAATVAAECGYCKVWKHRTSSNGYAAWASTGGPKEGKVIDLDKGLARGLF